MKDRIEKAKRENEPLFARTGVCAYCGQYKSVQAPEDATEQEVDAYVTENCNCEEAEEKRLEEANKAKLKSLVNTLFSECCTDEVRQAIANAGEAVCKYIIDKVQITDGTTKATIYINSKGRVVVKREEKKVKNVEM